MIKVDVISGFLGAGKTTFIKKLTQEAYTGEKLVLIENEFGEIGIDGGFLKESGIEISELNSGCICCSLVGDFGKNLREVVDKFLPDRIIVEPSGVGKLSDVVKSIEEVGEDIGLVVNSLVTVANAKKAIKQMKGFKEFFEDQIENATTIVLSRTQDMEEEKLAECVKAIQEKNPTAAIITTAWDELSVDTILNVLEAKKTMMEELLEEEKHHLHHHHHHHEHEEGCICHEHEHEHHHHEHEEGCGCHEHEHEHHHHHEHEEGCTCGCHDHDHHHADEVFKSVGIETAHKFDREVVKAALEKICTEEAYDSILRAKGILDSTDGEWIYFDMVPGEYEIRTGAPDYTGRLCIIGTEVDEEEMKELFGFHK